MKKLLSALLIVLLTMTSVYAGVHVGATFSYNRDVVVEQAGKKNNLFSTDSISVGLESRIAIRHFVTDLVGEISVVDKETLLLTGVAGIGATLDVEDVFAMSAVIGPQVNYSVSAKGHSDRTLVDALATGPFAYRVMLDIIAGPVIRVGAAYEISTEFTLENHDIEKAKLSSDALKEGKLTLCVLMKLF